MENMLGKKKIKLNVAFCLVVAKWTRHMLRAGTVRPPLKAVTS